jgi:hypothetical protein
MPSEGKRTEWAYQSTVHNGVVEPSFLYNPLSGYLLLISRILFRRSIGQSDPSDSLSAGARITKRKFFCGEDTINEDGLAGVSATAATEPHSRMTIKDGHRLRSITDFTLLEQHG